jgi:hypothetical protein
MKSMENLKTITQYIASWNNANTQERLPELEKCFAQTGQYVDDHVPNALNSINEMNDLITLFRSRLTHQLIVLGNPEFHHHVFRVKCKLENENGISSKLTFTGAFNEEGKINNIICFLDK